MSKKKKVTTFEKPKAEVNIVPFKTFFSEALRQGLVSIWQEREIHAFFKDLGLLDKESTEKYKDALEKY